MQPRKAVVRAVHSAWQALYLQPMPQDRAPVTERSLRFTSPSINQNDIRATANGESSGSQGFMAADGGAGDTNHRDSGSLASSLAKSTAMLDNAWQDSIDVANDMVDVDIIHAADAAQGETPALDWEDMDRFLSSSLGSHRLPNYANLYERQDHHEYGQDTQVSDASSLTFTAPLLPSLAMSSAPDSPVSPPTIVSTGASGPRPLSSSYFTAAEHGAPPLHHKRQHHPHTSSFASPIPSPCSDANSARRQAWQRLRPEERNNSLPPATITQCSSSGSGNNPSPLTRARCRLDCHVKLIRQLDYISESRTSKASRLPLDSLLTIDSHVRLEHDKILGCNACMAPSRANQTLMMVATVLTNLLDLFEQGCTARMYGASSQDSSPRASLPGRRRTASLSGHPSTSGSSGSSIPRADDNCPLLIGQLVLDDDVKYSCSRQLLKMFLERQIRIVSHLNELTIQFGARDAMLKVTMGLLCDITKRVHYFLGTLAISESPVVVATLGTTLT
ncbi:hypothetical protein LMH87_002011 [Akanthomyces muscarius]|uniref:Uncharacterized protein n=1 Tax=Akanthomyces muscarius TaxID=2231603 RepID=A0A9W8Q7N8_AKAMU|nr:hypothetical protein LMH87_002011 [Akanthomyces muscarius]KAJ4147498.1 hypothetical protein LMH87_002011 [Akanthomyces muscarius]